MKTCIQCDEPLIGRQKKYCSRACESKHYRGRKKQQIEQLKGTIMQSELPPEFSSPGDAQLEAQTPIERILQSQLNALKQNATLLYQEKKSLERQLQETKDQLRDKETDAKLEGLKRTYEDKKGFLGTLAEQNPEMITQLIAQAPQLLGQVVQMVQGQMSARQPGAALEDHWQAVIGWLAEQPKDLRDKIYQIIFNISNMPHEKAMEFLNETLYKYEDPDDSGYDDYEPAQEVG
jgi:hypothetical protein